MVFRSLAWPFIFLILWGKCKMRRRTLIMAILSGVLMLAGCGGGHSGGENNSAYLIGTLHGDMANVILENIAFEPYDGHASNRNILIALPEGGEIDEQYIDGIRRSYKAGRTIMMEDATPTEVNGLLEILGLNPSYNNDNGAPVALFAVEQIKGHEFYYVVANDDDADMDELLPDPEQLICETSDGTDAMFEVQEGDERDGRNHKDDIDVTEERIQDGRMARFMSWIDDDEERLEDLEEDEQEFRNFIFKEEGGANLKDAAEASSWDVDASSYGQNFRINYTSYSCHSFKNDQDFYAVKQSAVLNPSSQWHKSPAGKNCTTLALQYGHMRRYRFRNYWESNPGVASPLRDHSPHNANNETVLTSEVGFSLSGSVGFEGTTPVGGLSGGVNFSESKQVNVRDVTVHDNSASQKAWEASWEYVFKNPDDGTRYCACSELEDAPLLSRSNFSPVNQWIWVTSRGFRSSDGKKSFKSEFEWVNGRSDGAANIFWVTSTDAKHADLNKRTVTMNIPLEQPPLLVANTKQVNFTKAGESKDFTIVSAIPWTATCSQSWCNVQAASGGATDPNGKVLHITADDNDSGANREAVLTIKANTTSDVVKISIFQSKY